MTLEKSCSDTTIKFQHGNEHKFAFTVTINRAESSYLQTRQGYLFDKLRAKLSWLNKTTFEISISIDNQLVLFVGIYTVITALSFSIIDIAIQLGKIDGTETLSLNSRSALTDSENAVRSVYGVFFCLSKNSSVTIQPTIIPHNINVRHRYFEI